QIAGAAKVVAIVRAGPITHSAVVDGCRKRLLAAAERDKLRVALAAEPVRPRSPQPLRGIVEQLAQVLETGSLVRAGGEESCQRLELVGDLVAGKRCPPRIAGQALDVFVAGIGGNLLDELGGQHGVKSSKKRHSACR